MPLIVPTLDALSLPKITDEDLSTLKGKVMLFDMNSTIPSNLTQIISTPAANADKFLTGVVPQYFFRSQLPEDIIVMYSDMEPFGRSGLGKAGLRAIVIDHNQVVLKVI